MLTPGTTVAGYRIEGVLGEGGMATVYEAHQASLNRVVALKILAQRFGDDAGFRERFRRECEIQARLDHPNIVPVYGAGESEYGLWLTMRLVKGPTLRGIMLTENLSPARAIEILGPIASALDVAHESGLIHRDITPQNILVDERSHPYLSDFGITKGREDRSLTRTGQFVGTLDYVAPEQIRDEPTTAATDTYALAAILFECLTGRVPFDKQAEAAVLYAHIAEEPPAATSIDGSLPATIDPVMARGLAKLPDDRFHRASDLIAAAAAALAPPPSPPVPPPPEPAGDPSPQAKSSRSRAGTLAALAAALALVALAVGVATSGGDPEPSSSRVVAGNLSVEAPSGWDVRKPASSGVPGLDLARPLVLTPPAGSGGESVVVGVSSATGKTLLPPALRRVAHGPARGAAVALGSLEALRYLGLRPPGLTAGLTVFASPTDQGVATIACRPSDLAGEFSQHCQQLAASLRLSSGRAFPLGPSPRLEVALRRQLATLDGRRAKLRGRLGGSGDAAGQAAAATGLAAAFRAAARGLAGLRVTPQSAGALDALVAALRETRDAYKDLATAARGEDAGAYESATVAVEANEATVDRRLVALRQLGYRVGGAQ